MQQGIDRAELTALETDALEHSLSCLLDALRREFPGSVSLSHCDEHDLLSIGGLDFEISRTQPFTPAPLMPQFLQRTFGAAGDAPLFENVRKALIANLGQILAPAEVEALESDFENSVANLLLNRLLHSRRPDPDACPEPTWQGHAYYPFPGLRTVVSISDVAACSHLCSQPVAIPIYRMAGLQMFRNEGGGFAWDKSWFGTELDCDAIPIHPWHARRSKVIAELCRDRLLIPTSSSLQAHPLSSERTCRLTGTSHELKLALDVTLTGEHRLLFAQNIENAPAASAFAVAMCREDPSVPLAVQSDVAAVRHRVTGLAPFLSLIVRAPLPRSPGLDVCALNIWSGLNLWRKILGEREGNSAAEFFFRYALSVIRGPLIAWVRWGIGTEPHLQNSFVWFRSDAPAGLTLRDLDSSILNQTIAMPRLRDSGIDFPTSGWQSMPSSAQGRARLAHAVFHGHLSTAAGVLIRERRATAKLLVDALHSACGEAQAHLTPAERQEALRVWQAANLVKCSLSMRLKRSMDMEFSTAV